MVLTAEVLEFCRQLLQTEKIADPWCVNGLQVPGKTSVTKIVAGVSASAGFLAQASAWQADLAIVHHGLFWKSGVRQIDPLLAGRLGLLMRHEMALAAYHLPLDGHPEIGNNALIARHLGLSKIEMRDICAIGELAEALPFAVFLDRLAALCGQPPTFAQPFAGGEVRRVGICSGGGGDYAAVCQADGVDTFVTGEISEHHFHDLKEMHLNFAACGHYATETFGIRTLADKLGEAFPDLAISFFQEPCPV